MNTRKGKEIEQCNAPHLLNEMHNPFQFQLSRRNFLKGVVLAIGAALAACESEPLEKITGKPTTTLKPSDTLTPFPTSTDTLEPTETPTPESTPTDTPTPTESIPKLSPDQFGKMADEEIIRFAPPVDIKELGFPGDTKLEANKVLRGGEGANYVLYKNPESENFECSWNAETGEHNHAIYSGYEAEINSEKCRGIPVLILTDKTVLEESGGGGYFALNHEVIPDSQARVGNAFNAGLGLFHYAKTKGLNFFDDFPDFNQIAGYETLPDELEKIRWGDQYNQAKGHLRDRVSAYLRDKFLLTLNEKRRLGEPMKITFNAKAAERIDLTRQKFSVVRFVCSGKYPPSIFGIRDFLLEQFEACHGGVLPYVTQTSGDPVEFEHDCVRYDKLGYMYGGHVVGFMRVFFGNGFGGLSGYRTDLMQNPNWLFTDNDFASGLATTLCPPELQSDEIQEYFKAYTFPGSTTLNSYFFPFHGQQSSINFIKREK